MAMTAQQRSDAARKAAATKRAMRQQGIPPRSRQRPFRPAPHFNPPPFAAPFTPPAAAAPGGQTFTPAAARRPGQPMFAKPDPKAAKLNVLLAIENAVRVVWSAKPKADVESQQKFYDRYLKVKALALGPCASDAAQNEANSALGTAAAHLIKLVF